MKILFIHQNFPGQFKHLAPELAKDKSNTVLALTMQKVKPGVWQGVQVVPYSTKRSSSTQIHPWVADFEAKVIRGEALFHAANALKECGFAPDVIMAHPGWGESLFVKEVWPQAKLGIYCEFFYNPEGADVGFDQEFQAASVADACRLKVKNISNLLHFDFSDAALSPTQWQANTFPEEFRKRITVIHDGIDTNLVAPNPNARIQMKTRDGRELTLSCQDEVITFVNRNLEPYRGYHIFMRSLPEILKSRSSARVIIVGGNEVSYGSAPPGGKTWKDIFISEMGGKIPDSDWSRIHFVGRLSYAHYLSLLQISTVHVYLTYPFVLSWSLIEAMSVGCAIVASNTAPVLEVIQDGKTGRLVDFFDHAALSKSVVALAQDQPLRQRLGETARNFVVENYDLATRCLPQQIAFVESLGSDKKFKAANKNPLPKKRSVKSVGKAAKETSRASISK